MKLRDANGCDRSGNLPLPDPPVLVFSLFNVVNESVPGASDGSVEVQSSGGVGDHEYRIDTFGWQSSPLFSGLGAGTYTVQVQDEKSCQESLLATVGIGPRLGLFPEGESWVLFPNPARSQAALRADRMPQDGLDRQAVLIDATGRVLRTFMLSATEGYRVDLNLVDLASGQYMVRLTGPDSVVSLPLTVLRD
jgi:hypothetical protein